MMHLEHLNLVVRDIPQTLAFYQAALPHWRIRGGGEGEWYGVVRNWVHFGDDYNYLCFNDGGLGENRDLKSVDMGLSHFAFVVSDVKAVIERLNNAGFDYRILGDDNSARSNVYYIDPNGYEVEFVEYLTDIPSQRNTYEEA